MFLRAIPASSLEYSTPIIRLKGTFAAIKSALPMPAPMSTKTNFVVAKTKVAEGGAEVESRVQSLVLVSAVPAWPDHVASGGHPQRRGMNTKLFVEGAVASIPLTTRPPRARPHRFEPVSAEHNTTSARCQESISYHRFLDRTEKMAHRQILGRWCWFDQARLAGGGIPRMSRRLVRDLIWEETGDAPNALPLK